jgi:hypothetical protein
MMAAVRFLAVPVRTGSVHRVRFMRFGSVLRPSCCLFRDNSCADGLRVFSNEPIVTTAEQKWLSSLIDITHGQHISAY